MRLVILLLIPFITFSQNLKSGGKLKPEQAIMDVRHYTIVLDVDPTQQYIKGFTEIDFVLTQPSKKIILDLWHGLTITKAFLTGKEISYKHSEDDLILIDPPQELRTGRYKIKIEYEGKPGISERAPWTGGFQWEKDSQGNPWVAITCQGEGGKIFFPCKDHPSDEPNEGAELIITVPQGLTVAGPGLLSKQVTKKGKSTFHWKTNYTISNYCLVFNIGKFSKVSRTYTTINGNKVPMDFYVLEESVSKAAYELELMERACKILEKYFGEYPWAKEKIGLCETPHLGMEHQSLIAYGNKFRYTKVGGQDFDWLLVHEFGHEWWANKVTNRDWADMWIQEGICTFADALHIFELSGEQAYLERMQQTAWRTQNKLPIVQGDGIDSDQAYHSDIYGKGALFMHSLRYVLGDSLFLPTLKKLATAPQYTYDNTVTTNDVEKLFSEAAGKNMKPLFDLFLRTTNKLEILVKQNDVNKYSIQLMNIEMALPVEVQTSEGSKKLTLEKKSYTISSATIPIIDPKGYYLKRVILE